MHLWPVEWFTVSTATTQSPQPSTLLSIPRLEPQHSVHQSVRLQLHGGLQPQRKSVVRLGQQAFGNLSRH